MFSVARTAIRGAARPAVRIARRGYAETANVESLRLTLALPHEVSDVEDVMELRAGN